MKKKNLNLILGSILTGLVLLVVLVGRFALQIYELS